MPSVPSRDGSPPAISSEPDLICFSHLRWNFVYQRPQHLMSRYARSRRVYFVEEPLYEAGVAPRFDVERRDGVTVVVPTLPEGSSQAAALALQRAFIDALIATEHIEQYVLWYYTPLALAVSAHLCPSAIVYDCMDELSAFKDAAHELPAMERELFREADVVFTGGESLYHAKKDQHHNIHAVPSSVDVAHFAAARTITDDPADQRDLPYPRLGFFGVLDERLDTALLQAVADSRPAWQLVMIGPVVKIDPATLPVRPNIHYLGAKRYDELPGYIAGWDVALLLFARNAATRFISPTKTPEYLAAGKPVVSTSIPDVVATYGARRLVRIADNPLAFVHACERALLEESPARLAHADDFLTSVSWDLTWARTRALLTEAVQRVRTRRASSPSARPEGLHHP